MLLPNCLAQSDSVHPILHWHAVPPEGHVPLALSVHGTGRPGHVDVPQLSPVNPSWQTHSFGSSFVTMVQTPLFPLQSSKQSSTNKFCNFWF